MDVKAVRSNAKCHGPQVEVAEQSHSHTPAHDGDAEITQDLFLTRKCWRTISPSGWLQTPDLGDAFGAEELSRIPTPDGRLMSLQLRIGDGVLHIADEFPEMGVLAPPTIGGTPVVLALEVPDAEAVFAQAVAAGAQVRQPLADMFWGDRHGQLDDPFGHRWNVSQHVRDVSHDEIVAAAAQLFKK